MTEREFIEKIGPLATADMKENGVLASITIAQACLESGYGSTELATNANNLFGMKCILSGNTWKSVWDGKSKYVKKTAEQNKHGTEYFIVADFRKYSDILTNLKDHSLYLTGALNGKELRYKGLAGERNYEIAAGIIKAGGYATDVKYVEKLCNLIEKWNLTRFDVASEKEDASMKINKMISSYNYNTGNKSRIKYIVIHYVGALGGAKANCQYYGGGNRGASAHYFVDFDGAVWQCVEDANIAWHCGAKSYKHGQCRNANSIGIEMCVRKANTNKLGAEDKDWYFEDATVTAAADLTKYLMQKYGVSADRVIRHYDVTGKICPNPYVYNTQKHTWNEFKSLISNGSVPAPVEPKPEPSQPPVDNSTGMYKVTASTLNIRSGPGTNYPVTGRITDKGSYTIVQISGNWGKLKSGAGWICLDYTTYSGNASSTNTANSTRTVKVTATALNIRSGPGTNYPTAGQIKDKGTYTIIEVSGNWGKLKSGAGWICLDYTK